MLGVVEKVAKSNSTVLIRGETGTGKELIAGATHHNSLRAARNFVKVNCAALPENLLESELFGHEKGAFTGAIASASAASSRPTAARCSSTRSATWRQHPGEAPARAAGARVRAGGRHADDPRRRADDRRHQSRPVGDGRAGHFREDLYYRLNVVSIETPPLRERKDDILLLAMHFIRRFGSRAEEAARRRSTTRRRSCWCATTGPATSASSKTQSSAPRCWPKRRSSRRPTCASATSRPTGTGSRDSQSVVKIPPTGIALEDIERQAITEALKMANWVQKDAAELLQISPRVMNYKIKTLAIEMPRRRMLASAPSHKKVPKVPICAWGASRRISRPGPGA